MLGCYRRGEVADEEIFTRGVIAVLCAYPAEIVCEITDPATGLPSRMQWLPTIAEIKAACDLRYVPVLRQREADYRRLMQQRDRLAPPEVSAEGRARAVARWAATRAEMDGRDPLSEQLEKESAEERLADAMAGRLPRIVASESLRKKIADEARYRERLT